MENSKSIEQVIIESDELKKPIETVGLSDAARKSIESMARRGGGISDLLKSTRIGMSDAARKFTESMARPGGGISVSDAERKFMESMARRRGGISDLLKSTERVGMSDAARKFTESMARRGGGISDELKHSFEHTALLARNVDQSLSNMAPPPGTTKILNSHSFQYPNQTPSGKPTVIFPN